MTFTEPAKSKQCSVLLLVLFSRASDLYDAWQVRAMLSVGVLLCLREVITSKEQSKSKVFLISLSSFCESMTFIEPGQSKQC